MLFKRQIPVFLAFLGGFIMLLDYFIANPELAKIRESLINWARIGFTFATFIGVINLVFVNFKKVARQTPGWGFNLVLLLFLFVTMGFGFAQGPYSETTFYRWMYNNVYSHCSATMFGLLTFFIASAAFRAFRAKNFEATLLLLTAIVVMIGNVPIGDFLAQKIINHISSVLPSYLQDKLLPSYLQVKIMEIAVTAGQRAILMAATIGLVVFSIKILSGVDRSYFGGD